MNNFPNDLHKMVQQAAKPQPNGQQPPLDQHLLQHFGK